MELKFKGTIVISDPCYVSKKEDWGTTIDFLEKKMPSEFFTTYIMDGTGMGDGKWIVGKSSQPFKSLDFTKQWAIKLNEDDIDSLFDIIKFFKIQTQGSFTVDSGMFGIFYKEEIEKYNPKFFDEYKSCYTIIEDFDGKIDYVNKDNFYIYGTGNKTIFTY